MQDIRKLFDVLSERCEEEIENICNPGDDLSAVQLHSDIQSDLENLKLALDELESELRDLKEDMEHSLSKVDDLITAIY